MPGRLIIMLRWVAVIVLLLAAALIVARWKLPMRRVHGQSAIDYWRDVFTRFRARRRLGSEVKRNLRALARTTALIVDPDEKSSRVMAWKLESLKCSVVRATSGRQGIVLARERAPDFAVVDAGLRDMSAEDFLHSLPREGMPVVFVGASGGLRERLKAFGGNVACYAKPYDPQDVAAHAGLMLRHGSEVDDRSN